MISTPVDIFLTASTRKEPFVCNSSTPVDIPLTVSTKHEEEMERIVTCNTEVYDLLRWINVEVPAEADVPVGEGILFGKTFVITGVVNHFKNRAELQAKIEELGGKATGSVTGKTSYLINNDVESTSGKNKKAKELGVPIISEDEFLEMIGE